MKLLAHFAAIPLALLLTATLDAADYNPLAIPNTPPPPQDTLLHDTTRQREIPLRIYLPVDTAPAPVVLFSHGLGGSREGSAFLGRQWAARGYVAVFLQHHGSDEALWQGKPEAEIAGAMRAGITLENFLLRAGDVKATLDQLAKWNADAGHFLAGRLDLAHVAMTGHSFGAQTTQAVSGQSFTHGQSLTDPRIKAAIVFSPGPPSRGTPAQAFGSVRIPWLLMTGTEDVAKIAETTLGTSDAASRLAVFPALPPGDKYELVLDGARHLVFTDRPEHDGDTRNPNHHRVILALSTAFLDTYLKEDPAARTWLQSEAPRQVMEEHDRWQRK